MKRIFIIPALIFVSAALFLYVVLPQISSVNKAKKDFLNAQKQLNDRQKYFLDLKNSLEEVAGYQDTLKDIDDALPGEVVLVSLIEFFNQKATNNGLTLKSLIPATNASVGIDENTAKEKNPAQYFSLALSGSISSFESFLKDIETSSKIVDVENIFLNQNSEKESSDISISVKVYY